MVHYNTLQVPSRASASIIVRISVVCRVRLHQIDKSVPIKDERRARTKTKHEQQGIRILNSGGLSLNRSLAPVLLDSPSGPGVCVRDFGSILADGEWTDGPILGPSVSDSKPRKGLNFFLVGPLGPTTRALVLSGDHRQPSFIGMSPDSSKHSHSREYATWYLSGPQAFSIPFRGWLVASGASTIQQRFISQNSMTS